jgi:hypothetical protein
MAHRARRRTIMRKPESATQSRIDPGERPPLITIGDQLRGMIVGYECVPYLTGTIDDIECCHAVIFSFHGLEVEHVCDELIDDIQHYVGIKFVQHPTALGWDESRNVWTTDLPRVGYKLIGGPEPWRTA